MQRLAQQPRDAWPARLEALGFAFHHVNGEPYWVEDACYRFSAAQIDVLEQATQSLHELCLDLADDIVRRGDYARLSLDAAAAALIEDSWRRREPALYGRMDLSWDGVGAPKLLEYNADTPTALFEASVVQWFWLRDQHPQADQFNMIHEKLIAAWRRCFPTPPACLHFTGVRDALEDWTTVEYLRDTAHQAGVSTKALDIGDIGWNGRYFDDPDGRAIDHLSKLYPWEWLLAEPFGRHIANAPTRWIEPAWKMLWSTKALLPALWQRFGGHPNLLPAARQPEVLTGAIVRKPRLGREGQGVSILPQLPQAAEPEGDWIYQSCAPLPEFAGWRPVIGSWVIGDEAAGIGIREDRGPITGNGSRFVPHFFI